MVFEGRIMYFSFELIKLLCSFVFELSIKFFWNELNVSYFLLNENIFISKIAAFDKLHFGQLQNSPVW